MKKCNDFSVETQHVFLSNISRKYHSEFELKIKADVIFGAANKSCRGLGICQVLAKGVLKQSIPLCRHAPAEIILTKEQQLVMTFKKENLCKQLRSTLFDAPLFIVEDAFELPQQIVTSLKLPKIRIAAGIYPILEEEEKMTIIFLEFDKRKPTQ